MNNKASPAVSPLAPRHLPDPLPIAGVRLGSVAAGIRYKGRNDLTAILFDHAAQIAGVFTRSKCPSAPVDWCRRNLAGGTARCVIVNSGNANAFTGKKGAESVRLTAQAAKDAFGCRKREVFIASTGVIGEPLDASGLLPHLKTLAASAIETGWLEAARAIMTTDTYPKLASRRFEVEGGTFAITGMAKGAGMLAPDMATMLSFVVTDFPATSAVLQKLLSKSVNGNFNAITVDSDTSTSDTLLLFSAPQGRKLVAQAGDRRIKPFAKALDEVLHELAMMVVRDGEGATKHVQIDVKGAKTAKSAKRIALSVANSPLVKTAIAGRGRQLGPHRHGDRQGRRAGRPRPHLDLVWRYPRRPARLSRSGLRRGRSQRVDEERFRRDHHRSRHRQRRGAGVDLRSYQANMSTSMRTTAVDDASR